MSHDHLRLADDSPVTFMHRFTRTTATTHDGRQLMNLRVRTITAVNLRLGDVVIPDHGPRRRVTLRRLEGAHPVVVVQFEGVPGANICYPPSMPLLIEESD
jgi:hypothetical protein